jgi:hypothetical protein
MSQPAKLAFQGHDNSCETCDALPPEWRALVHEFGASVVRELLMSGVTSPDRARHLIGAILIGATEPGNKIRSFDLPRWAHQAEIVLSRVGCSVPIRSLQAQMRMANCVIAPLSPSGPMIMASMKAIEGMPLMTKPRKHTLRLTAALTSVTAEISA